MNRSRTVTEIARRLRHLKKRDVNEVFAVLVELWSQELVRPGGYVRIEGLGKLYVEQQTMRTGGVVRRRLLQKGQSNPETLDRFYFRFSPAEVLRAKLVAARDEEKEQP